MSKLAKNKTLFVYYLNGLAKKYVFFTKQMREVSYRTSFWFPLRILSTAWITPKGAASKDHQEDGNDLRSFALKSLT